jgi:hypothetical protein
MHGHHGGLAETAGKLEVWPRGCLPAGRANDAAREPLGRIWRIRLQGAEVDKKELLDRILGVTVGVVRHSGSSQS